MNNKKDTYTYYFVDGTEAPVLFDTQLDLKTGCEWNERLWEMDRQEYNNQHTETRRHSSLESQDPKGLGGFIEENKMEQVQLSLELEDALKPLAADLKRIVTLLEMGYMKSEIAKLEGMSCATISRKVARIREALIAANI